MFVALELIIKTIFNTISFKPFLIKITFKDSYIYIYLKNQKHLDSNMSSTNIIPKTLIYFLTEGLRSPRIETEPREVVKISRIGKGGYTYWTTVT